MPASISQHRTSTGIDQNKLHDNLKSNAISARGISSNLSAIPDEICQFGNSISQIVNSHQSLYRPFSQNTISQPGITAPLLMLLSLVRLSDSPPQVKSDHSVIIYGEEFLPVPPENTARPNNGGNIFSTILNPVANILYETGQFISQYDPLIFPRTDATILPLTEIKPETDISFFSDKFIRKIRN